MKHNVGRWDRGLRLTGGAAALGIGMMTRRHARARAALLGFGATQLLIALVRYCPLNQALGVNTSKSKTLSRREVDA